MKADNRDHLREIVKGVIISVLIAGCFFALNQRLPVLSDIKSMVALTVVCVAGSMGGLMTDTMTEELLDAENAEDVLQNDI